MYTGLGGWLLKTDLSDLPPNSEVQPVISALRSTSAGASPTLPSVTLSFTTRGPPLKIKHRDYYEAYHENDPGPL